MYVPDNYDLWEKHDREMQEEMDRLPVCGWCGEPIQDEECYKIGNKVVCVHCMEECKVHTTDLMI